MKGGVFPSQTGRPRLIVISGNDGMLITIPVLDGYNQDDGSNVGIDISKRQIGWNWNHLE